MTIILSYTHKSTKESVETMLYAQLSTQRAQTQMDIKHGIHR